MTGPHEVIITDEQGFALKHSGVKVLGTYYFPMEPESATSYGSKDRLDSETCHQGKRLQHGSKLKAKYNKKTWGLIPKEPGRGQWMEND